MGKISFTPMETILIISKELEYLEGLVKLARRRKDVETAQSQMVVIIPIPNIRRVCINKMNCSKMFHLVVEINQALLERLVNIGASMSIMATSMVKKLSNLRHLIFMFGWFRL
jgi:hypothetical protein